MQKEQAVAVSVDAQEAPTLEKNHVYEVYDVIANHFSNTRYKAWPRVEQFLNSIPPGGVVADVGCGNGKYLGVNSQLHMMGSDRSVSFAKICKEKGFECMAADNLSLPYRDNAFNSAISIAVIHHFATPDRRLQSLQELMRIIKPGGKLLVAVWALQQDWKGKNYNEQDVMIPWHFREDFKKNTEKKTRPRKYKNPTKQKHNNPNYKKEQGSKDEDSVEKEINDGDKMEDTSADVNENQQANNDTITNNTSTTTDNGVSSEDGTINSTTSTEVVKSGREYDVYQRYYHLFVEGELESLVAQMPNTKLLSCELDHDNWYLILEKLPL